MEAGSPGAGVGITKRGRVMGGRVTVVVDLADVKIAFRGKGGKCTSNTRGSHSRMHSQRQRLCTSENGAGAREQSVCPDQHDENRQRDFLMLLAKGTSHLETRLKHSKHAALSGLDPPRVGCYLY